jgi:sugar phosphate isomerase/epimerase
MGKPLQLKILAINWGFSGTIDQFCRAAKKEGYDGIEVDWPRDRTAQQELFTATDKYGLEPAFLCDGWQQDVNEHLATFTKNIEEAANNSYCRPLYINCHSGKDYYSMEEGFRFIDAATKVAVQTGIPVYHETHRGRLCYAATVTRQYLLQRPDLVLNADFSHWCNVHESLLEDQEATMELALARLGHIHARIGHPRRSAGE